MAAVTLAALRAKARERADMVGSLFITDTADSLDQWINEGAQKLHDLYVQAYGEDYVEKSAVLTTIAGTSDYALPADFYKLLGVGLMVDGEMKTVRLYNRAERNRFRGASSLPGRYLPKYKLTAGLLRLLPAPTAVVTGEIVYSPLLQVTNGVTVTNLLVDPADTINFPNGAERFVVKYAARIAMSKQETNVSDITLELDAEVADLKVLIETRNAAEPKSAVDIENLNEDPWEE